MVVGTFARLRDCARHRARGLTHFLQNNQKGNLLASVKVSMKFLQRKQMGLINGGRIQALPPERRTPFRPVGLNTPFAPIRRSALRPAGAGRGQCQDAPQPQRVRRVRRV